MKQHITPKQVIPYVVFIINVCGQIVQDEFCAKVQYFVLEVWANF